MRSHLAIVGKFDQMCNSFAQMRSAFVLGKCAVQLAKCARIWPNIVHLVKCRAFRQLVRCAAYFTKCAAHLSKCADWSHAPCMYTVHYISYFFVVCKYERSDKHRIFTQKTKCYEKVNTADSVQLWKKISGRCRRSYVFQWLPGTNLASGLPQLTVSLPHQQTFPFLATQNSVNCENNKQKRSYVSYVHITFFLQFKRRASFQFPIIHVVWLTTNSYCFTEPQQYKLFNS